MALIVTADFESSSTFSNWQQEVARGDAIVASTTYARKGTKSGKFNFKKTDVTTYNGYVRAEFKQNYMDLPEAWFGFSQFLPSDHVTDPMPDIVAQWHEIPDFHLGENYRSPPISFMVENGNYRIKIMWAAAAVNTNNTKDGERYIELGAVTKNAWVDWVFHIRYGYGPYALLEVYKNKTKVYTLHGPNSYNDVYYPYFKFGIYKPAWNGWAEYSPESERTIYFDEVKVGDGSSNLDEVSPAP